MNIRERMADYGNHWMRGVLIAMTICVALIGGAFVGMLVFGIAVSVAKMFWAVPHPDVYYIRLGMAAGTVLLTPYVLSRLEEEGSLDPEKYIKR